MAKIEFFKHNINDEDIKRVNSVLRSIFLTTGEVVKEFEEKLMLSLPLVEVARTLIALF